MTATTEYLVRNSDNTITLNMLENNANVSVTWTQIDIAFGGVTLTRTAEEDGITFASGVLDIIPGSLTTAEKAALDALQPASLHRAYITVISALEPSGVQYGAADSDNKLFIYVA